MVAFSAPPGWLPAAAGMHAHAHTPEMHGQENECEALMHILTDPTAEPIMLSYRFLENITNNFSKDLEIGTGGFGVVYMGIVQNMKVAIKKLSRIDDFSEKQFEDELKCLKRVKHKNIVRFLGYCSDAPKEVVEYKGAYVLAECRKRFLCFEYVPNKSLEDYIKDESHQRDWDTRYHLIEGICQGLHYLHNKERINHLDLKPANILLDAGMVPKITDFGLSRRFSGEQSRIIAEHVRGTLGYIAPEYINKGEISFKTDIYSLGIIIRKLLMGNDGTFDLEGWHESKEMVCPRAKKCSEIAKLCVDANQQQRPTIDSIIDMLNLKETLKDVCSLEQNPGHERMMCSHEPTTEQKALASPPTRQRSTIAKLTTASSSLANLLSVFVRVNHSNSPEPRPKPRWSFEEGGGVGLGIIDAIRAGAGAGTEPIATGAVARRRGTEDDENESYTCVITHVAGAGGGSVRKRVYFGFGDGGGGWLVEADEEAPDFLSRCFLCDKRLDGLDIYMYRAEKAFCSSECRCQQMLMDDRTEALIRS